MKTFIEIGSCDFNTLNGLSDKGWRGVIVEPVKEYFDNLEKKPNINYLNCAVDVESGTATMYRWNKDIVESDSDYRGMTTMNLKNTSFLHLTSEITVPTITYNDLIKNNQIDRVDLLKIDTEGHDLKILKTVEFDGSIRPKIIKIEHAHCNLQEMIAFLESKNYHIELETYDIYAIDLNKD